MSALDGGRLGIAACAVGVAQAALDTAVDYAQGAQAVRPAHRRLPGLSFLLADMATQVEAARALYLSAARLRDAGQPFGPQAAMSKLFATDTAMRVATDAVQVLGGYGYVEDFPAERYLREAKILQIVEGTNQVQRVVIGRALTADPVPPSLDELDRQLLTLLMQPTAGAPTPTSPATPGCRRAPCTSGCGGSSSAAPSPATPLGSTRSPRAAAVGVHLDPADRPRRPGRRPRAAAPPDGRRGLPQRGGGGELHPQVRVAGPAELEQLLQEVRAAAGVPTRTTVVLSTPWEDRAAPPRRTSLASAGRAPGRPRSR